MLPYFIDILLYIITVLMKCELMKKLQWFNKLFTLWGSDSLLTDMSHYYPWVL